MSVTIDLRPDIEAALAAMAADEGLSLPQFALRVLEGHLPRETRAEFPPAERVAFWRDSLKDLPRTPPLSEDAISRESLYDRRG